MYIYIYICIDIMYIVIETFCIMYISPKRICFVIKLFIVNILFLVYFARLQTRNIL